MEYAIFACFGFCIANFLYELIEGAQNWGRASERSFFQAWAVITYEIIFH